MKRKLWTIIFGCIVSLQCVAQNNEQTIFDSLQFENGVARKPFVVDFINLGKGITKMYDAVDPANAALKKSLELHSNTAMEFTYANNNYYFSLHDNCMQEALALLERKMKFPTETHQALVTIDIYEDITYNGWPYAVIMDIKGLCSHNNIRDSLINQSLQDCLSHCHNVSDCVVDVNTFPKGWTIPDWCLDKGVRFYHFYNKYAQRKYRTAKGEGISTISLDWEIIENGEVLITFTRSLIMIKHGIRHEAISGGRWYHWRYSDNEQRWILVQTAGWGV